MHDNCNLDSHCNVTLSKPNEGKSNHLTSNHKYLTSWYINRHVYSLRTMLISLIVTYKGLTNGQTHKNRNYHLQKVYLYQSLSCILFSISQRPQPFIFKFLLLVNIIYNSVNKYFFICILLKFYHQTNTSGIIIQCIRSANSCFSKVLPDTRFFLHLLFHSMWQEQALVNKMHCKHYIWKLITMGEASCLERREYSNSSNVSISIASRWPTRHFVVCACSLWKMEAKMRKVQLDIL